MPAGFELSSRHAIHKPTHRMVHTTRGVLHTSRPRATADSFGTSALLRIAPVDHRAARGVLLPTALPALKRAALCFTGRAVDLRRSRVHRTCHAYCSVGPVNRPGSPRAMSSVVGHVRWPQYSDAPPILRRFAPSLPSTRHGDRSCKRSSPSSNRWSHVQTVVPKAAGVQNPAVCFAAIGRARVTGLLCAGVATATLRRNVSRTPRKSSWMLLDVTVGTLIGTAPAHQPTTASRQARPLALSRLRPATGEEPPSGRHPSS